ncbi:MAG: social motility and stimulation tgl protein [Myxococcota bacterium]
MFSIDDRLRGLPATKEQVVSLYQSINTPHLAVPGKPAGPAQAFIVGLRGSGGFAVFVYLYLNAGADCAVYIPSRKNVTAEQYKEDENEAMGFVESMGFMMDNMNFRGLSAADQEQLVKTLPVFQKDPRQAAGGAKGAPAPKESNASALGRLFAAF